MLPADLTLNTFDPRNGSDAEYALANDFFNIISNEAMPDEPLTPLDDFIRNLRSIPPFVDVTAWYVTREHSGKTEMVAEAHAAFLNMESNKHIAEINIAVLPELRRQGIGTYLLGLIVEAIENRNRRLLMANTFASVPAGEAFMERFGAKVALVMDENRLDLDELGRGLIGGWLARAPERAAGFELVTFTGPIPEEDIDQIALMQTAINSDVPHDDLEFGEFTVTPERIRENEQSRLTRGVECWAMYAREEATGNYAGYTELFWNPTYPDRASQGITGVLKTYRNLGLGRWLKAAMLTKLLEERPGVRFVSTHNAKSNAPMLRINYELGFKPYKMRKTMQVEVDRVKQLLAAAREPAATP